MLNAAAILLISLHHKLDLQSYCELCYTLSKLWFVPHQYDLLNLCHHTTTGKCKDHSPCVPMMRTMMLDLLWARPIYKFNKSITLWLVIVGITICTGLEVKRTLTQLKWLELIRLIWEVEKRTKACHTRARAPPPPPAVAWRGRQAGGRGVLSF